MRIIPSFWLPLVLVAGSAWAGGSKSPQQDADESWESENEVSFSMGENVTFRAKRDSGVFRNIETDQCKPSSSGCYGNACGVFAVAVQQGAALLPRCAMSPEELQNEATGANPNPILYNPRGGGLRLADFLGSLELTYDLYGKFHGGAYSFMESDKGNQPELKNYEALAKQLASVQEREKYGLKPDPNLPSRAQLEKSMASERKTINWANERATKKCADGIAALKYGIDAARAKALSRTRLNTKSAECILAHKEDDARTIDRMYAEFTKRYDSLANQSGEFWGEVRSIYGRKYAQSVAVQSEESVAEAAPARSTGSGAHAASPSSSPREAKTTAPSPSGSGAGGSVFKRRPLFGGRGE